MQNTFVTLLGKLLSRFLDEVVFIELKEKRTGIFLEIETPEVVQLPVYLSDLADRIRVNEIDNIPAVAIIKGLVYVVGANADLPHMSFYKTLLLKIDADIVNSILKDGIRYATEKQLPNAILYFNAAINLDSGNIDAYYNLGRAFDDLGEAEERPELRKLAKYCYEKCLEIDPNFGYAYFNLGFSQYNEDKFTEAEASWLKALEYPMTEEMREEVVMGLGRVRDKAAYEKGYTLILSGRVHEGLEVLSALEEDHDEWWNLLFFLGVGNRMLERYEDALGYFLKVMSLNTGHIQTMNEIGICMLSIGDYSEAERYFKEALRLSPENAELICNIGIVHYNKGDEKAAREHFDRAHRLAPEDEVVQMWLDHLNKKLI